MSAATANEIETQQPDLTVVVPVFNESDSLPAFWQRLDAVLGSLSLSCKILFVDDGSTDSSAQWLADLAARDTRVANLRLSRNFGKEAAMTAGLDYASGRAVVVIDADLQDPPELIPKFVEYWEKGFDVVYGKRDSRPGESWLKRTSASLFYRLMDRLSDVPIPRDTGDFRLLSRRALDALTGLREQHRYMKGLFAWVGFPQKAVSYVRAPRQQGKSKWDFWRLWNLALEGITSFSAAPLKLATLLGLATSLFAFAYGTYFLLRTLLLGNPIPGYPSLIVIMLFLGGVQLVCLGIIGEYLARTYGESKGRGLYIVMEYAPTTELPNATLGRGQEASGLRPESVDDD